MANITLSHALADCLDALREGESLKACLNRYPEHGERLRPLLEVAETLHREEYQAEATPSPDFVGDLKSILTEEMSKNRKGGGAHRKSR